MRSMARTSLMRLLVSLVRGHNDVAVAGHSPNARRPTTTHSPATADEAGLTRRQFVSAVAALGGAGCVRLPRSVPRTTPVSIVGGGIAGLAAAHTLAGAGIPAIVYEASTRVGGRMHSHRDGYWDDGQVTEWCGELIDANHKTLLALARRFDLPVVDLQADQPAAARPTYFVLGQHYRWERADEDFKPVREALARDFHEAGSVPTFAASTPAAVRLDRMSVREWIESRVPGGTRSPLGAILDVAFASDYGADTADLSALNLAYLLGSQQFGMPSERQYHIAGGNEQLPLRMAELLPPGAIALGWRLEALARRSDDSVVLTFATPAGTREVNADHVILALPFAVLRTLDYERAGFDVLKRRAIQEVGRGRNAKLHMQFRRRVWTASGPWGRGNGASLSDLGYQTMYEVSRGQAGASGVLVNYRGGAVADRFRPSSPYTSGATPAVAAEVRWLLARLDRVWPGVADAWNGKVALSAPALDPNLGCSYSYWRVGQYHTVRGYERIRQRNIHFAGEHCSVEFQGYMEGGAAEGIRAANEVRREVWAGGHST
jgi:monoamine oxidase